MNAWAVGAVGSALDRHSRGRWFESNTAHHNIKRAKRLFFIVKFFFFELTHVAKFSLDIKVIIIKIALNKENMKNTVKLISAIIFCFLPGIIGGFFTANNLYPWFNLLTKPSFNPPSWLFSPVWTLLYTLMGISLFWVLKTEKSKDKTLGIIFFCIQLFINGLWSIIFFGLHQILVAFVLILLLLLFIILSIWKFYKISKPAAYILVPYLLWICYATILNFALYLLNR